MPKAYTIFECGHCGHQSPKWLGNCPECGTWNSFSETATSGTSHSAQSSPSTLRPTAKKIDAITAESIIRIGTHIAEFDRVLGGGMVAGMVVLLGGEPGIGKSTLMSQMAALSAARTLYVSSEETASQIKIRIERLCLHDASFHVLNTTELETIVHTLKKFKSQIAIIDSIQMLHSTEYSNPIGGITQLKICCQSLIDWARENNAILFLIAHVTKEGTISGPKVIEHLVDTVLYFDEAQEDIRFLRASKNRFGNLQEIGIFKLEEKGLIPLTDPNALFLSAHKQAPVVGVVTTPVYEGSRVLLVEIQALTIPSSNANARVYSDIIDPRRISRIAAVLERHANIPLSGQDIYLNIAGGIRIQEVAIDLGIAHALYSAFSNNALPAKTVVCGEVSLAGEIKPVSHLSRRIKTACELGYTRIIAPHDSAAQHNNEQWNKCSTVSQSIDMLHTLLHTG